MQNMQYVPYPNLNKIFALVFLFFFGQSWATAQSFTIHTAGNTYRAGTEREDRFNGNIIGWSNPNTTFNTYFRTKAKGQIDIAIHARSSAKTEIYLNLDRKQSSINISNKDWQKIIVGKWNLTDTGYHELRFSTHSTDARIDIDSIYISGPATNEEVVFIPNNQDNFYYWGRRGPSVHLSYDIPKEKNIEWFYNEITVPVGSDPVGSYFMADGFSVGYFGFQVNATDRRHVLFSVWSPFGTDNPQEIPEDKKIKLLKKGDNVHTGEFGNEGSGGQSYLVYPWKAGTTYKFLLHAKPNEDSTTDFTAYFYAPEYGKWQLIASFKRPHTYTFLKGLHSFLENFDPEMGNTPRLGNYGNQWACTSNEEWLPIRKAVFTIDATGHKNYRKDYASGSSENVFFLKNGGFFSNFTKANSLFTRSEQGNIKPEIDFSELP